MGQGRFLIGAALRFDGVDDFAQIPDSPDLHPQQLTLSLWFKGNSSPGQYKYLFARGGDDCTATSYGLQTGWHGGLDFYVWDGNAQHSVRGGRRLRSGTASGITPPGPGTARTAKLFVDGKLIGQGSSSPATIDYEHPTGPAVIGGYHAGCDLLVAADIDQVMIWSTPLPVDEHLVPDVDPVQPPGHPLGGEPGRGHSALPRAAQARVAAAHRRPPSSPLAAAGSTSWAPAAISASGEASSSRSPASATRRRPIRRSSAASLRSSDDADMSPVAVPTTMTSGRSSTASRWASIASSATQVTAASPRPSRIASARPGTRSTITTVGHGRRRRAGRQLCFELCSNELRALRGRRVLGERRGHALAIRRAQGHRDREQRSALGGFTERDLAAVELDELPHDGEPQPGAGARVTAVAAQPGAEPPEDRVSMLRWHARAGIGDDERCGGISRGQPDPDAAADRCVTDGVCEQVGDDAARALDVEACRQRLGSVHAERDLPVGGERLELLRDRPDRLREVRVDERQPRFAVVGLDLLQHVVDLLERAECRETDRDDLGAEVLVLGARSHDLLRSRDDDTERRTQVMGELAEQPLPVVVHLCEPLRERRQLGVLVRESLFDALAVRDLAPFGDDEGDLTVTTAEWAKQQVQRADALARRLDPDVDVEAGEAARGGLVDRTAE